MFKKILLLVLFILFASSIMAEPNDYWNEIKITGSIYPPIDDETTVEISDGYCNTMQTNPENICFAKIAKDKDTKNINLKIKKRGYKIYTKNIANINFENGISIIALGKIALSKSDAPIIRNIIKSYDKKKNMRFEITFQNEKNKEFLVSSLNIMSFIDGDDIACCCPPSAIFKVDNNVEIKNSSKGGNTMQGAFQETLKSEGYSVEMSGKIIQSGCNGSENMQLSLPISFIIPKEEYSAVHIELPQYFFIKDSYYTDESIEKKPSPKMIENGKIIRFENFLFTFTTGDNDELDIKGSYPLQKNSNRTNRPFP